MPNRVLHAVVFWLKPDAPPETARSMTEFYTERIAQVDGVEHAFAGPPAGTQREVVDGSYQLMSGLVFSNEAAASAWQVDPVHDAFRERFEAHFERVVVYDSLL